MTTLRLMLLFGLLAGWAAVRSRAEESNAWPFWVGDYVSAAPHSAEADDLDSWTALGPFLYSKPAPNGERVGGLRPFYIKRTGRSGETAEVTVLYPLFYYRSYGTSYEWSLFKLINRYGGKNGAPATPQTDEQTFDVWPFYFSRNTGNPATSYHALLPIAGRIQDRFGFDRISWTLFPLYLQTARHGAVKTSVPWPIFSVTRGTENGFGIWPLFGRTDGPDHLHREFFLWPLGWDNAVAPAFNAPDGAAPTREVGFLPFYTGEHGAGFDSENYLWPFFGYTRRTGPRSYDEKRYFWPFLVQGRGDHYVNRWGPVYTHSVLDGMDKTWIVWPLWRRAQWTDDAVTQTKSQFFYFLYWSLKQRSATNPSVAPAEKVHWWPFYSSWDNGAGHRQFQVLNPLEVFFPNNDDVRQAWTPFFALFRYDEQAFGSVRGSLFWNGITWNRDSPQGRSDFHLGPLFSVEHQPDEQRVALGDGLLGLKRRTDGSGWRFFLFEFSKKIGNVASP